jgi:thiol-disulfide isomerase/thioredoxin
MSEPTKSSEPGTSATGASGVPGAPVVKATDESDVTFVTRLGLALIAPRWAFAIAGDRRNSGRSGSDLMRVIGLLLVGGHLRGLVVAAWLAIGVHGGLGLRTGGAVLSAALTSPLAFLVISAALLWAGSGRARHMGRAFDLSCVAAVPLMLVLMVGVGVAQTFELHMVAALSMAILGLGFGWAGALASLALTTARMRVSVAAVPPREVIARGHRAGLAALGVVAAMAVLQLGWIALHGGELRPVTAKEPAPAFALPEIGAGGKLGEKIAVRPGKPALPATEARPILIDFWATWCGVCLRGLPELEAFRKAHPEIDMISVNLDDAVVARQIFDAKGYGLRLLFDDNVVSKRYNVSSLPHLVVVDRNGLVHQVVRGHPGELEALLPAHEHAER